MANIQRWTNAHGQQEQKEIDITPNDFTTMSRELIALVGEYEYNVWVQTLPMKVQANSGLMLAALAVKLGTEKLESIKNKSYLHFCTLKNIAHYDQHGFDNKEQIVDEMYSKLGYSSLDEVKAEFPQLWK